MRNHAGPGAARGSAGAFWTILISLFAYAALTHWLDDPPAPQPADAPATIFSAQRAAAGLRELVGDGVPHPLASSADERIRTRLRARLAALGIPAELQSGWVCDVAYACGQAVNVIARIDGADPASGAVLLAAHYDSVPAGPGAGDDGVGVASILEIARILKLAPAPRHPVILLIDEGEETGLLGARLFVDSHPLAGTVRAVVNLDARGDSGPSLMFETGAATDFSMRLFANAVARPKSNSLYYFIYRLLPNDTDFTVFKAAGYEGFNFALIGDVERYHTPQDTLGNLDLGSLQHQGQNALQAVQALADADLSHQSAAGAVFFDVFGRVLVHWPASWAAWVGVVLVAALAAALWPLRRRAALAAQEVEYSLAALLAGWVAVILVAALLVTLVRASGAVPPAAAYGWAAHPLGMHVACVALALLAPLAAVRMFARRISAWGLWLAYLLLQAAFALLCSLAFAELSFLFVVPVAAGLLGALLALRAPRRSHGPIALPPLAVALPVWGAAFTLLPSVLMTYAALGADAWPIITAVCGLVALGLAPLLGDVRSRTSRACLLLATFAVVAGGLVTALQSAYSMDMPQRTLLWYALDADAGTARWILQPDSKRSAPQLALDPAHELRATSLPLGIVSGVHSAPAPRLDYAPPQLEVIEAEPREGGYAYRLRLRSPRGAAALELAVPRGVAVKSLAVLNGAQRVPAKLWRAPDGTGRLDLVGAGAAGVELELVAPDSHAFSFRLLDRSYGLPPAGAALRQPGPALTTASQDGDLSIVYRSITLGPGAP
jgi:hypothetical protein